MHRIDEAQIIKTMQDAEIQSATIASGNSKGTIHTTAIGAEQHQFGVASLSKPVFTYLVLKLISADVLKLDTPLNQATRYDEATQQNKSILSFAQFCRDVGINLSKTKKNRDRARQFTPAMILSHQTGLPITYNGNPDPKYGGKPAPIEFDFEPGEKFGYSGLHLIYLQQWIEAKSGKNLEELAREYVFSPIGMTNSSFHPYLLQPMSTATREHGNIYLHATRNGLVYEVLTRDSNQPWHNVIPWRELPENFPRHTTDIINSYYTTLPEIIQHANMIHDIDLNPNAANSLHTTAEDYIKFCIHMMNDPDPLVQQAFHDKVSLTNDPWAVREKISADTLQHLAWGYGWGLEKNDRGEIITAFHTGDMNDWRAGVQLDLVSKTATVLFTKSNYSNGHVLQEQVFGRSHALDYFFDKFKFARTPEELADNWKKTASYGVRKNPEPRISPQLTSTAILHQSLAPGISPTPADQLRKLYAEDQRDRILFHHDKQISADTLSRNDYARRDDVDTLMAQIKSKSAADYYHAAVMINHSNKPGDSKLAHEYAKCALALLSSDDHSELAIKIREEYAFTHDRYLLEQGKPQQFGTTYSAEPNDEKGWEANKLVPPNKGYAYTAEDRIQMNLARKELGIISIEQQEREWNIPPAQFPSKPDVLTQPLSAVNQDPKADFGNELKPK